MQSWHPASNVIHLVYATVIKALIGKDWMRLVGPCLGPPFSWCNENCESWPSVDVFFLGFPKLNGSILYRLVLLKLGELSYFSNVKSIEIRSIFHFPIYNRPSVLGVLIYPGWYHGPLVIHQRYVFMLLEKVFGHVHQPLVLSFSWFFSEPMVLFWNSETSRLQWKKTRIPDTPTG